MLERALNGSYMYEFREHATAAWPYIWVCIVKVIKISQEYNIQCMPCLKIMYISICVCMYTFDCYICMYFGNLCVTHIWMFISYWRTRERGMIKQDDQFYAFANIYSFKFVCCYWLIFWAKYFVLHCTVRYIVWCLNNISIVHEKLVSLLLSLKVLL